MRHHIIRSAVYVEHLHRCAVVAVVGIVFVHYELMLHSRFCAPRSGFVNVDIVVCGVVWAAVLVSLAVDSLVLGVAYDEALILCP